MTAQTEPSKRKVLIADDDLGDRTWVKKVLKNRYIVIEADNGIEAVNLAQSHKPDVIFMDMLMPVLDGLTALTMIKADVATKAIPIVMFTGVGHGLNKKIAESLGASGYLTKPITAQELLETISRLLE